MEYNRYKSMSSFYLSGLIGIQPTEKYVKAAKDITLADALYSALLSAPPQSANREKLLEPVTIFHNEVVLTAKKAGDYTTNNDDNQFYVSLGIFDLDTSSAVVTVTKDNKLELTWSQRAGKGKFTSIIPSYLVATSAPVLTYEGGVLDIRVNVESRRKNETVFVGKLVESKS
jgi:hypothetical protein